MAFPCQHACLCASDKTHSNDWACDQALLDFARAQRITLSEGGLEVNKT